MSLSWAKVQKIVREFPGVVEASAHGRSGFKVGKKFLCAFNEEENAIGIRISFDERDLLMSTAPKIYYVTDHYRPYPSVLVSLDHVSERELRQLIERCWHASATAKLAKAYDEEKAAPVAKPRKKQARAAMTPSVFRKLARSLPGVSEGAHMGHADFRVGGKIFATLGYPDDSVGVVMLAREEQQLYVDEAPDAFAPVKGGWGLKGSTTVILRNATAALVKSALTAAWQRKAPKSLVEKPATRQSARRSK